MRSVVVGLIVATMAAASAGEAGATVTLTASRLDTLYTTDNTSHVSVTVVLPGNTLRISTVSSIKSTLCDRFENGNATNTYRFKIRGEPVQ